MSSSQRSKEDAMDYRYFPEPDLPPLIIAPDFIEARKIGDIPIDRRRKYIEVYKLQADDARILSNNREISDYYEKLVRLTDDPKKSASYITTVLFALFEAKNIPVSFENLRFEESELARTISLVNADEISSTNAKIVVEELFLNGGKTDVIVDAKKLRQVSDTGTLEVIAQKVIADNPGQVAEYKSGKENLFGFFVGQCMKASAGQGNPKMFTEILKGML